MTFQEVKSKELFWIGVCSDYKEKFLKKFTLKTIAS